MKWLLIFLVFLITPVLAQPVDIEIFENSAGDYFINYENHSLEKCNGTKCTLEINETTSNATIDGLSKSDLVKIQMIFKDETSKISTSPEINETLLRAVVNDCFEKNQANDRAWVSNTWMPANSDMTNLTLRNQELQAALNNFNGTVNNLHAQIDSKEKEVQSAERDRDMYMWFGVALGIVVFLMFIKESGLVSVFAQWREK